MHSQPLPGKASRRLAEEQFKTPKKVNFETKCRYPTPKCAGGAAILTIEWLDGDRCHARTLYRNYARRE